MIQNCKKNKKSAFTLLEISIVMVVISLIVVAVAGGSYLISSAKLTSARIMTDSAPMLGMKNLVLWLETTSQESYVNGEDGEDENGNGLTITSWKSLNNQVFGQVATAVGSPKYNKTAINGMPGIEFDGSTTVFTIPDSDNLSIIGDMTVFAVVKTNTSGSNNQIITKAPNDSSYRWRISASTQQYLLLNGTGNTYDSTTVANQIDKPSILSLEIDIGSDVTFSRNKVTTQTISTSVTSITDTTGLFYVGGTSGPGEVLNGSMGELIMFNRLLSQGEKNAIFDYLSKKWVIALE